jgi:ABC-type nitrate/sulfonate/bicarbonate transport system substrate-binding protein
MKRSTLRGSIVITATAAALILTGCATTAPGSSAPSPAATGTSSKVGAVDLSKVCPANVVIQTDWNPESEQGDLYQLIGGTPVINAAKKAVSGPLYASGSFTGVNVEVRAGGPAIGFQSVTSQQYADKTITLGYANTDEAIQLSNTMPTTAVFAPFEVGPQIIMWDPATYPKVKTIADLGKTNAVVRYFGGATYMDYLTGSGLLKKSQVDGTYDGSPAKFVVDKGTAAQQGFATVEPYVYENELPAWGKKVAYQLINDAGYPIYASALAVRTGDLKELSPCLKKLVPVIQQATVDYYAHPAKTNALIVKTVTEYNNGWVYDAAVADYSAKTQVKLGLVGNGDDKTVGNFDLTRVQKIIDITKPLFAATGTTVAPTVSPETIVTNEFIDKSIGFSK